MAGVYTNLLGFFPLDFLPNETLDEIIDFLDSNNSLLNLQRTCHCLHDVVSRRLYRHVDVSDFPARKFMKTIVETNHNYGEYTRSLAYSSASNIDSYLTYPLFGHAIHHFINLQTLTLVIPRAWSMFFFDILHASSAIYPAFGRRYVIPPFEKIKHCIPVLPCQKLRELNIHGDLRLIDFAVYRSLASVCVTVPMEGHDLQRFVKATTNSTNKNKTIVKLFLTFSMSYGENIARALWDIGYIYDNLKELDIRAPSVNAMEASAALALFPPMFPNLFTFSLNLGSILETVYAYPEKDAVEHQKKHIIQSGNNRESLTTVTFGSNTWRRDLPNDTWDLSHESVADVPATHGANFLGFHSPLFWDVYYWHPQPFIINDVNLFAT